ncbi:amino acid transporter, transmembrane domain-containing protein [Artemisia annua]|uniref:Amino acid transporter, transmembrane domain-containing protein n=1 Tax=Artemisia annua TaxID=35608 RepID=A0A2U1P2G8_ARTAN|nr:amino acid transporter, transmembrane domain-containing protein [Artemisia annua]
MEGKKQEDCCVTIPLLLGSGDVGTKANIGTASFISTFFNGLNALSGIGILSVPYALATGGWFSLILLFVIASTTFYTGLLIQRCMDADPTIRSYPDIGEHAFGKTGRTIVSVTMNIELYLVATGFLILEGDNLSNLFPDMEFDIFGYHIDAKSGFIVLVVIIILPTSWLNSMSILSYVSASGVLASLIIIGSILWAGAFDGIGFQEKGTLVNWNGIPSAISLYAFCYCAHPVFPTLYTSMRDQRQFPKVLFLCFAFCTVTYSLMAVVGYLMFGSRVDSQITLNLPTNNISSRVAICTILVTPIAKYALMLTPIVNTMEARFQSSYNKRMHSFIIRTTLIISTAVVALSLPFFGYLMSLVGALLSATASITIPCLCYLRISGIYRRIGIEMVIVWFVVLTGIVVAVVGTYVSLVDIISHL